jgi:glutamate carboxypeptidase
MTPEAFQACLASRLPDHLASLRRAVLLNSFTTNAAGVDAVGELTAELFAPLGFAAEFVASDNPAFGRHLFLSRPGRSGQWVAFVSHLDTVFPPEEEVANDFRWREDERNVYGPGVADIKGGTVVALMALEALRAVAPNVFDQFGWLVALDSCEEQMTDDFASKCRARLPKGETAAVLVMECGADNERNRLVVMRKGMANFRVAVTGGAAHSGTGFWHGKNAIVEAAALVPRLSALSDRGRELTVNVGVVRGGTVTNRVPHECVLEGELRAFDPAILREAMGEIGRVVADFPAARLTFGDEMAPWPENDGSNSLLAAYQRAGERLGLRVELERRGGLSDGNLLWSHAPTIDGLGPSGGCCHCSQRGEDGRGQEYAVKASFVRKAALTALMLAALAESSC